MFSRAGRKRPTPRRVVDPETPDTMFPHLPRWRADLLREETMRHLHAEGFDTSWRPDGRIRATPAGQDGPGQQDGTGAPGTRPYRLIRLDALSHRVAAAPYALSGEITDLVHDFLTTVLTEVDAADLTGAEFLRRLRVRLVPPGTLDATPGTVDDASREFTGDLHVALSLNHTDHTGGTGGTGGATTLDDRALAAHGTATADELADLYRVGYRNTWQDLHDAAVEVDTVDEVPGAPLHVIGSDCAYLASAPLFIDDLLPRWLPGVDVSCGVIVAVPHPRMMLVREVTTGQDLLDGINTMTAVALTQLTADPDPLTARLHLAHDGEFRVFTDVTTDGDGQQILQVDPDNYLLSRLESEN
ncbi:hypothetical protein AALF15_03830 [Corynebacteriaceae bacterium 7-707]